MVYEMIPNIISICRIVLSLFVHLSPIICMTLGAITDALDGFVARKLGLSTYTGAIIDIVADKFLLFSWYTYFIQNFSCSFYWMIAIFGREIILFLSFIIMSTQNINISSILSGKVYVASHMIGSICVLILHSPRITTIYMILTSFLSLVSILCYAMSILNEHLFTK